MCCTTQGRERGLASGLLAISGRGRDLDLRSAPELTVPPATLRLEICTPGAYMSMMLPGLLGGTTWFALLVIPTAHAPGAAFVPGSMARKCPWLTSLATALLKAEENAPPPVRLTNPFPSRQSLVGASVATKSSAWMTPLIVPDPWLL